MKWKQVNEITYPIFTCLESAIETISKRGEICSKLTIKTPERRQGRPYHFKFFKGCLPQISLGPFLNTLSHLGHHEGK